MRITISGTNYEVSSNGEVFNRLSGKKISPQDNGNGYLYVNLHVNGKHTKKYVHRLVAEAFIPNPDKWKAKSIGRVHQMQKSRRSGQSWSPNGTGGLADAWRAA